MSPLLKVLSIQTIQKIPALYSPKYYSGLHIAEIQLFFKAFLEIRLNI
jgi:hypothetical protein